MSELGLDPLKLRAALKRDSRERVPERMERSLTPRSLTRGIRAVSIAAYSTSRTFPPSRCPPLSRSNTTPCPLVCGYHSSRSRFACGTRSTVRGSPLFVSFSPTPGVYVLGNDDLPVHETYVIPTQRSELTEAHSGHDRRAAKI